MSDEIRDRRNGHGDYKWQTDSRVIGDDDTMDDIGEMCSLKQFARTVALQWNISINV